MRYSNEDITYELDRYDFVLDADEGRFGYRVDWGSTDPLPFQIVEEQLAPNSNSRSVEGAEELFSVADLADCWRLIFRDFSGGAGQKSRDVAKYVAGRYAFSRRINIWEDDGISLGPAVTSILPDGAAAGLRLNGQVLEFGGKVACGTTTNGTVAFYDPQTGGWTTKTSAASGQVTAFGSDGQYLYAAFGSAGIYRCDSDDATLSAWATLLVGVTALCYCTGYLYAVQGSTLGYIDSTLSFVSLVPVSAITPTRTTIGLQAIGSWVYWGVRSGVQSWVYSAQYNPGASIGGDTDKLFEQYLELPRGFVGTSLAAYGGDIYVGGYHYSRHVDTGKGAVYMGTQNGVALLVEVGPDPNAYATEAELVNAADNKDRTEFDNRVIALAGYGHELWITTTRQLYRWDIRSGGYCHVADVGGSLMAQEFSGYGATWEEWVAGTNFSAITGIDLNPATAPINGVVPSQGDGWQQLPKADQTLLLENDVPVPADPNSVAENSATLAGYNWRCALHRLQEASLPPYTQPEKTNKVLRCWSNQDVSPNPDRQTSVWYYEPLQFRDPYRIDDATGATFELGVSRMMGRCGSFGMQTDSSQALVRLRAGRDDDDDWSAEIAVSQNSEGLVWNIIKLKQRKAEHLLRLTIYEGTATLYVDGVRVYDGKIATGPNGQLDRTDFGSGVWFAAGWGPTGPSTAAEHPSWLVDYTLARFCLHGAWMPMFVAPGETLSTMAVLTGTPFLPTSTALRCVDLTAYAENGELVTSWSTGRMPGVLKTFLYVDVDHVRLDEEESIGIAIEADDGSSIGSVTLDRESAPSYVFAAPLANARASRVRLRLVLQGPGTSSPKLSAVTLRYGVEPVVRYQFLVDLRQHVKTKTGEDYDWERSADFLRDLVDVGRIVTLYHAGGSVRVRPEALQQVMATPSGEDVYVPQGLALLRLRKL